MFHKYCLAFILLLFCTVARAQTLDCRTLNGSISGTIVDSENASQLVGVTLRLFNSGDTTPIQSTVSNSAGEFNFNKINCGIYNISFKIIGYTPVKIDSIVIRTEKPEILLSELGLTRSTSNLEVVTVYAEKPLIENKDGKIIFNASESALSNSAQTIDLLKQTPLVSVDPDGKVLMRGKEVKILIDDKPVDMDARQLQDLLESMPGSMIEKIEVLTTPPPQFANERGGVINIVTKKGKVGISGRLNMNYGTRGEGGIGASTSYKNKKFSLNGNVGMTYNQYRGTGSSFRENFFKDSSNYFRTESFNKNRSMRPNGRISMDYDINKMKNLNLTLQVHSNTNSGNAQTSYKNINRLGAVYRQSQRDINTSNASLTPSVTFAYTRKSKLVGEVLKINGSMQFTTNDNDRNFYQEFLHPSSLVIFSDSTQQQLTSVSTSNVNLRFNYDRPIRANKLSLHVSGHLLHFKSHNILSTYFMKKPENEFVSNDFLSNDLWFYQTIAGLRAGFRYNIKPDYYVNAGILEELTETNFDLTKLSGDYKNKYRSLLPFFTISKKWQSGYNLTGSYKRSIQRPGLGQLNPSVDYGDPYNQRFGNPYLKPYYAENFDLVSGYWNKRYSVNLSLGYNILTDIYSQIRTLEPESKTITTWQNISGRKEYETNFWSSATFHKKLKLTLSVGYTYNVYTQRDKIERNYRDGGSLISSLTGNYTMSALTTATANFTYNSFATPQGKARNRLSTNVGIQQKFLKKALSVSLQAVDALTPQHNYSLLAGRGYQVETRSFTRSENYRVAVAYVFRRK